MTQYFNGIKINPAPHITTRRPKHGDMDLKGRNVAGDNLVFCYRSAGMFALNGGKTCDNAPAIPIVYAGTHYGYGKPRYNTGAAMFNNTLGIGVEVNGYWTRPFYVALDGNVYTGTVRKPYMLDNQTDIIDARARLDNSVMVRSGDGTVFEFMPNVWRDGREMTLVRIYSDVVHMKEVWSYGHASATVKPSLKVVQLALSALKQTTGLDLCYEGAFQLSLPFGIETS